MLAQASNPKSEWAWLGVSAAALVWTYLIREPIGTIAVGLSVIALAFGLWRNWRSLRTTHLATAATLCSVVLLTLNAAALLTAYRVHVQGVPSGMGIYSHGFSHNLYLGLGSEPNPFGISWSDTAGEEAVKAVDPNIVYGSERYFQAIGKAYFEIVRDHPLTVFKIYASRASRVLTPFILPVMCVGLGTIVVALRLLRAQGRGRPYDHIVLDTSMITAIAVLLHVAQAVFTVPVESYYFQATLGLYILSAIALGVLHRLIWGDLLPVKGAVTANT